VSEVLCGFAALLDCGQITRAFEFRREPVLSPLLFSLYFSFIHSVTQSVSSSPYWALIALLLSLSLSLHAKLASNSLHVECFVAHYEQRPRSAQLSSTLIAIPVLSPRSFLHHHLLLLPFYDPSQRSVGRPIAQINMGQMGSYRHRPASPNTNIFLFVVLLNSLEPRSTTTTTTSYTRSSLRWLLLSNPSPPLRAALR